MTRFLQQISLIASGIFLGGTAFAHPSGEHYYGFVQGLWHLISEPDHLLLLLAGISLVWYIKRQATAHRRSNQKTGD